MERREFLKLALGFTVAAGSIAAAASAQAFPMPGRTDGAIGHGTTAESVAAKSTERAGAASTDTEFGARHRGHWHRHRRWHRRHWSRRYWRPRHWRHRHWRRRRRRVIVL